MKVGTWIHDHDDVPLAPQIAWRLNMGCMHSAPTILVSANKGWVKFQPGTSSDSGSIELLH
jgi:hypothetical protein